jgi:NAD(P)-dependent dehydrogenase (short-subunit alcohol dehydrogenase family)
MTDRQALVITGASGTVGQALASHLAAASPLPLHALGRTRPAWLRPGDCFHRVDLSDPAAASQAAGLLAAGPPPAGLVCAAGADCRAGLGDFEAAAFTDCVQVNCIAHLQLLQGACQHRPPRRAALPVVLVSSEVIGQCLPASLIYAAAKAAAEEGLRHAAADLAPPGAAILIVRLPDIGVPMRAATAGPVPPPGPGPRHPRPVLSTAARTVTRFICDPPAAAGLEVWHE